MKKGKLQVSQVSSLLPSYESFDSYTPIELLDVLGSFGKMYFKKNSFGRNPQGVRTLSFYCNCNANPVFESLPLLVSNGQYQNIGWPENSSVWYNLNFFPVAATSEPSTEQLAIYYLPSNSEVYNFFVPNAYVTIVDEARNVLFDKIPYNYFMRKDLTLVTQDGNPPCNAQQAFTNSPIDINVPIDWANSFVELDLAAITTTIKELQASGVLGDPDTLKFSPFVYTFYVTYLQL